MSLYSIPTLKRSLNQKLVDFVTKEFIKHALIKKC